MADYRYKSTTERQYARLTGDATYSMEKPPLQATDVVSSDYQNMAILLGDVKGQGAS